ncbi:MAG: aspartate carbamoyltransferase catalytic subunit [Aquificaceae bacterium]
MPRRLISIDDLSKEEINSILQRAKEYRAGKRESLSGSVALIFLEPSTRTRLSFERACKELGFSFHSVSRPESSIAKGESFLDTLITLKELGFCMAVFRLNFVLFPYKWLENIDIGLINAGDATHQHPTQALTDLLCIMDEFERLEGLNVLFVGDILHSRVFRSDAKLFSLFGANIGICGPFELLPEDLSPFGDIIVFKNIDEAINWADITIWLRLQKERHKHPISDSSYFLQFGLTKERHRALKGKFMHPGPVITGVDMEESLVYSEKSLIKAQVRNGLYIRMATLKWVLDG